VHRRVSKYCGKRRSIALPTNSDGEGLTAHFTDGSMYHGDVLVGADGPKSKVREILLGAEKAKSTPLDIVYNMSIVKYNDAKEALHVLRHPQNSFGYNPNGTFSFLASMNPMSMSISLTDHDPVQDMPDPKRPETWTFQVGSSWLGQRDASLSNEERLARTSKERRASYRNLFDLLIYGCRKIPSLTLTQ
jgi:2-polyprenyl-6-methoxyphenol hydroxylase-like FAD-dependent oxidoreductase